MDALVRAVKDTDAWREFDEASRRQLEIVNTQCFYHPASNDNALYIAGMAIRYVAEKRQAVMRTAAYERLRNAQMFPMTQDVEAWRKLL